MFALPTVILYLDENEFPRKKSWRYQHHTIIIKKCERKFDNSLLIILRKEIKLETLLYFIKNF